MTVVTAPSTNASTLVRPSWRRDSLERVLAPARKMGRGAHGRGCRDRFIFRALDRVREELFYGCSETCSGALYGSRVVFW